MIAYKAVSNANLFPGVVPGGLEAYPFGKCLKLMCAEMQSNAFCLEGVLLGIRDGGVPPGSPNPDPISDQNMPFSIPMSLSLMLERQQQIC